ncbi:Acg family FMN-binding oxidoreductase [Actinoplanes friuliensis]|uniref:Nitroreductase n=1 Tax=Actinoplanes friuliensis DSM 7358 TaxID=1246995 RepID=U5W0Q8_9ACTN|nr:nitroreductase [Actinoplanes friuliensis]AGZ42709.1 nitroreductase [Actinoplanes friuliensis DSM 7358]
MITPSEALEAAALAALHAPSVYNTQPWRWRISGDTMTLHADHRRELAVADPDGRLLLLSCGAALQHARTALAAAGWQAAVERMPEPGVLARLTFTGEKPADPRAQRLAAAIVVRHTDRRAYAARPVPEPLLDGLRRIVEAEGAYLHVVRRDQVPLLAVAAEAAGNTELADPAYREELRQWTSRPAAAGDGVPATTAVRQELRRVPVRDFAPDGDAGLSAGDGHDTGSAYVVVFGSGDRPLNLLCGGEAMSALLLAATADGLATAPLSDTIEVAWSRQLMRDLLSGVGEPYLAVRLGYPADDAEPGTAPRRAPADVIEFGD